MISDLVIYRHGTKQSLAAYFLSDPYRKTKHMPEITHMGQKLMKPMQRFHYEET